MIGNMEVTDDEMLEAANKAVRWMEDRLAGDTWVSLGIEREDASQEALIASHGALRSFDGSSPVVAWMFLKAKFGLKNYVAELRKDRKERSSARVVQVGLDDEEVVWSTQELDIDDEDCGIQPEAQPEIPGAEIEAQESRVHARTVIDAALLGALEGRERRVIRLAFGLDGVEMTQGEIADKLGVSRSSVQRSYKSGMSKLRAEMQVNEIMGL